MGCFVYLLIRMIGLLPRPLLQVLGRLFGLWLFYARSKSRRITEINLARCFPKNNARINHRLTRESLIATCQTALETPAVWCKDGKRLLTWIDNRFGEAHLKAAIADDKGVLLLIPHIGNWELYNAFYAQTVGQLTALFKPPKQKAMARIIERVRMRYGNQMVPTTPRGLARLFKVLKQGGTVAVLPDQVPEVGLFVPFFGQAAFTDRLAHRLALKSGATPVLVALIRNARGRFDVHYQPVPDLGQEDEVMALTALNAAVEALVRQYPTQYQWEYKRFKKQPAGLQDPYQGLREI